MSDALSPFGRFDLRGRVAVLTGGAGFLGREFAGALSAAGASVVLADINYAAASSVADAVSSRTGGRVQSHAVDITDEVAVQLMVREVLAGLGRIDILVNSAALDPKFDPAHRGENLTAFESFPVAEWNRALAVDLTGMFLCTRECARPMMAQGKGVVINISSIYGLVGPDQRLYERPGTQTRYKPVTYSVTKSAVIGFTRYLSAYWGGKGIRVNALTLGGVNAGHDPEFLQRYGSRTPLGRMAAKEEANEALVFLASDASSYMTGSNLVVDGGWTAW